MRVIFIVTLLFMRSCGNSPGNEKEISFDTKFKKIWEKMISGDTNVALKDVESYQKKTNDLKELSYLYNVKGWIFYLSANGFKDDAMYKLALKAFLLSKERDSFAGIAIVGQLIESYPESLFAAKKFLNMKNYSHQYSIKDINLKAVLLNGSWSAYFLRKWKNSKEFLDKIDSQKKHYEIPDSLISDLKNIVL